MANGRSPHVLDAMTRIKKAFDELPSSSIMRCWLRADCFPVHVAAVVRELLDGAPAGRDPHADDDAHAIFGMLRGARSVGVDTTDNGCVAAYGDLLVSGDDPNALPAVQAWFGEEERIPNLMALLE